MRVWKEYAPDACWLSRISVFIVIIFLFLLLSLFLSLHSVAPANMYGAEGAAEQQQMVESIHTMIGDLEVEKQSFLATMNSQQVQSLFVCFCQLCKCCICVAQVAGTQPSILHTCQ